MTHKEKTELLKNFARGVEEADWNLLKNTLKQYNDMLEISVIREMKRNFYHQKINADGDEEEMKRIDQMNQNLERVKKKIIKR